MAQATTKPKTKTKRQTRTGQPKRRQGLDTGQACA